MNKGMAEGFNAILIMILIIIIINSIHTTGVFPPKKHVSGKSSQS